MSYFPSAYFNRISAHDKKVDYRVIGPHFKNSWIPSIYAQALFPLRKVSTYERRARYFLDCDGDWRG